MVRVSQPVLSMLPSGARAIGPSAGLLEGPDGGVVFVFGLATFSYAAGDEVGRRLTAVQLVAMRISSAREVAGAFGVSTVTLWRWSQTFAHGGVLALGRDRSGPKGPTKLTEVVTARIVALDGQGRTLGQIAAGTAVSTATVRVALGRVAPRGPSVQVSGEPNVADDWQIDGDGEQDTEASVGAELVVLAAPVPRVAERTAARFGELAEAPVVFTEGAHLRRVDAGFNLLTYYKGTWTRSEPTAFATVDFTTPDGTTATYELAERLIDLAVPARPATPAQAGRPASTLTLRLIVRRMSTGHQTPILTNRTDLSAAEIAYRMATRWRQENYFKYAREHFALDALDSYADQPDDLDRMVPNPAKAHAHDQVSAARTQVGAAHADIASAIDTATIAARQPGSGGTATVEAAPGQALTAADTALAAAKDASRETPSHLPLSAVRPGSRLLETERKLLTHAIRMSAYNTESALARLLRPHYPRGEDEGRALLREAFTLTGDLQIIATTLHVRLDPASAPRRSRALAALATELTATATKYPGTDLTINYSVKGHDVA